MPWSIRYRGRDTMWLRRLDHKKQYSLAGSLSVGTCVLGAQNWFVKSLVPLKPPCWRDQVEQPHRDRKRCPRSPCFASPWLSRVFPASLARYVNSLALDPALDLWAAPAVRKYSWPTQHCPKCRFMNKINIIATLSHQLLSVLLCCVR